MYVAVWSWKTLNVWRQHVPGHSRPFNNTQVRNGRACRPPQQAVSVVRVRDAQEKCKRKWRHPDPLPPLQGSLTHVPEALATVRVCGNVFSERGPILLRVSFSGVLVTRDFGGQQCSHPTHFTCWNSVQMSQGNFKHVIPGMSAIHPLRGCTNGGRRHENFFEDNPPCVSGDPPTRKGLRQCLWSTSKRCIRFALGSFRR